MSKRAKLFLVLFAVLLAGALLAACGGSSKQQQTEDENTDIIGEITGPVEIEEEDTGQEKPVETAAYTGPTKLTVNIKVSGAVNTAGTTCRVLDRDGNPVKEGVKLGEPFELNQGSYNFEFISPAVFGKPTYVAEDETVAGETYTLDAIFPAGEITLFTYKGKAEGRCVPTKFTVKSETKGADLEGKGETCKPLVLETGAYEVLLVIDKKTVQPVKLRVNAEQKASAKIKLEK